MVSPLRSWKGIRAFVAALATALVSAGLSLGCLADVRSPGLLSSLYAALVLCHLERFTHELRTVRHGGTSR